jgi:hypothetical protein
MAVISTKQPTSVSKPLAPTTTDLGVQLPYVNPLGTVLKQGVYYFYINTWFSIVPLIIDEIAALLNIPPAPQGAIIIQTTTATSYTLNIPDGYTIDLVFLGSGKLNSPANPKPGYSFTGTTLTLTQSSVKAETELAITLKPL